MTCSSCCCSTYSRRNHEEMDLLADARVRSVENDAEIEWNFCFPPSDDGETGGEAFEKRIAERESFIRDQFLETRPGWSVVSKTTFVPEKGYSVVVRICDDSGKERIETKVEGAESTSPAEKSAFEISAATVEQVFGTHHCVVNNPKEQEVDMEFILDMLSRIGGNSTKN